MSQKEYTFEIRFLQMFIVPPWAMYQIITGQGLKKNKFGIYLNGFKAEKIETIYVNHTS